jgi:23S rRNA (cytosine1962-C5)-methyltransferase
MDAASMTGSTQGPSVSYPIVRLNKGRERSVLKGHPWIFSGAVAPSQSLPTQPGEPVRISSCDGSLLGLGFYNPLSDIAIRVISKSADAKVDASFWRHRVRHAKSLRETVIPRETDAFRLINAEGDGMPGLVVDQYGGILVLSIGTAGMDRCREELVHAIVEEIRPVSIIERSEGRSRKREGLTDRAGVLFGEVPAEPVGIRENGLRFMVDVLAGQKTGFFLDQRSNREIAGGISSGALVLNCFSYTGAFSVYCAAGGAKRVVSVDSSDQANQAALKNMQINGFSPEQHPVHSADVFRYLREGAEPCDFIILDPPAFAKSRRELERAARGYKDINLSALLRLKTGGWLMTFSCSNAVDADLFGKIVLGAAADAKKKVQSVRLLDAGPDHPVLLGHTEGRYLKGLLLRVCD